MKSFSLLLAILVINLLLLTHVKTQSGNEQNKTKDTGTPPNGTETGEARTEDIGKEDTSAEDTEADDTETGGTENEDTGAEDTGTEDNGSGVTGNQGTGTGGAGNKVSYAPEEDTSGGIFAVAVGLVVNLVVGLIKIGVDLITGICDILKTAGPLSLVFKPICTIVLGDGSLNKLVVALEQVRQKLASVKVEDKGGIWSKITKWVG